MHLGFHGGHCCGIKTIRNMGYGPTAPNITADALDEVEASFCGEDGATFNTEERFFLRAAPKETNLERLDRYLAYLEERREAGAVEITLATKPANPTEYWTQEAWIPVLEERGFKKVCEFLNSNSMNTVVWMVKTWGQPTTDDEKEKK